MADIQGWPDPNERYGRLIATFEDWELRASEQKPGSAWKNFTLIAPPSAPGRKHIYRGGGDGQRMAHRQDMGLLRKRHPAIYRWLEMIVLECFDVL
jgi:hypothetical protein